MEPSRLLPILLLVANATGAAALVCVVFTLDAKPPHPLGSMLGGVALGQIALAGAWLVWGKANNALRLGLVLVTSLAWTFALTSGVRNTGEQIMLPEGERLFFALFVCTMLAMVRLCGLKMKLDGETPPADSQRRWQFTVASLLTWTAIIGMFLGLSQGVEFKLQGYSGSTLLRAAIAATLVVIALRVPSAWHAVTSPLAFAGVAILLLRFAYGPRLWQWHEYPLDVLRTHIAAESVIIVLAGGVLQVAGYRLVGPFRWQCK